MLIEFLNKLYSEYLDEKLKLESEQNNLDIKVDENKKFIQKLKEEEDKNFNAFSPRNRDNNAKEKIEHLKEENLSLIQKSETIENKIEFYNSKLKEIDILLKEEKQKCSKMKEVESHYEEDKSASELRKLYIQNLTNMIYKLEFCSKLIQIDPARCKIELSSISKMIRETIDEIYKSDLIVNVSDKTK